MQYKTVIVQITENSQIKKLDDKVNKLLNEGWELYGEAKFDHCSQTCMDAMQTLVKREAPQNKLKKAE